MQARQPLLRLEFARNEVELGLSDPDQKQYAVREVVRFIKSNNRAVRETIREQIRRQLANGDYQDVANRVMLTWDQVQRMLQNGMTFGGHTMTHLNLPNADPPDARQEIAESREVLEKKLGVAIRHFSVPNSGPYAYYNEGIKQMVAESGYLSAVTSAHGFVDPQSDLLKLRRIRTVPSLPETIATIELGKFSA
jgi:peptidoglycan/xylan/chitin deacetylase (PgdA/CDA1 family)